MAARASLWGLTRTSTVQIAAQGVKVRIEECARGMDCQQ